MAEFRHALMAFAVVFALLVAAVVSASGGAIFQRPDWMLLIAIVSAAASLADVIIRARRRNKG